MKKVITLDHDEEKFLTYLFRTILEAPKCKGGKTDGTRFFTADRDTSVSLLIDEDEGRILGSLITRIEANALFNPTNAQG